MTLEDLAASIAVSGIDPGTAPIFFIVASSRVCHNETCILLSSYCRK